MEAQRMSAQNNLAVAERNAQSAALVAQIHGQYGLKSASISAQSAKAIAELQAANAWNMNQVNLDWQAQKLSTEQSFEEYIKKNYPQSMWGTIGSALSSASSGITGTGFGSSISNILGDLFNPSSKFGKGKASGGGAGRKYGTGAGRK